MTRAPIVLVAAWLTCTLAIASARAQVATYPGADTPTSAALGTGLDSGLTFDATLARRFDPNSWRSPVLAQLTLTLPYAKLDVGDYALAATTRTTLIPHRLFGVHVEGGLVFRHAQNAVYTASAPGWQSALLVGHSGARFGVLGELGIEQFVAARMTHSAAYRRQVYDNARDGWYRLPATTLRAGLRLAIRGDQIEGSLTAGVLSTAQGTFLIPPVYGRLGIAYAF